MTDSTPIDSAPRSNRELALGAVALLLFVAIRVALLVIRDAFYDELFTQWILQRSFGGILEALRHDSGPPLYYFLAKAIGATTINATRFLSLGCATATAAVLLGARRLGPMRFAAVLLLAVYPPSLLESTDARAYALCALFVTTGIVALRYDRPLLAACAFALGGYSHYYGVLFFPTLLPRVRAFALACILFLPGFYLASIQPAAATAWNSSTPNPMFALPFAGIYPDALFASAPFVLFAIAWIVLVVALAREWRAGVFVVVPLALAIVAGIARPVYFPPRFESVIAVPLVLWIAASLARYGRKPAIVLGVMLFAIGAAVSVAGIDRPMPTDPYREAGLASTTYVDRKLPVVASGYLYLETLSILRGAHVGAFPAEQATHPGWRTAVPLAQLRAEAHSLPRTPFTWIGERAAPELRAICEARGCRILWTNDRAAIVEVRP
jgi:hypothetical protein